MADNPVSQPASDQNANQTSEATSQPQPASDLSALASESASTQPEVVTPQDQSTIPASESAPAQPAEIPEAPPTPEPPQVPQTPVDESVSMSTSPVIEPSGNTPPAQDVPPAVEPIKEENQTVQADTEPQGSTEAEAIPSLHNPFYGPFPATFDFGAQPKDEVR